MDAKRIRATPALRPGLSRVHIVFLVEERSAEVALDHLLPTMLGDRATFQIRPFNGKADLLQSLERQLRGLSRGIPGVRFVVLVDLDDDDCQELKRRLDETATSVGLRTPSSTGDGAIQIVNRIAIEELEAWFFGDPTALRAAYPGVSATLERKAPFRDPDAIRGGTWEALLRVLQRAGYYKRATLPKLENAALIAQRMDPARNRSRSFQVFQAGLERVLADS
jgi:hypothetical protein